MARNYVSLPHEYLEEMDILSDAEFGRLCRALLRYSMTGKEGQLQGAEKVLWKRAKMQEDRFQENYRELSDSKREAGKKGAAKRWHTMAGDGTDMSDDGEHGYTETKTDTNTPPPNGGRSKRAQCTSFTPPTLEEVTAYVQERGSKVDPQGFIDFYAAKGWLVGKTPMKDWKAACRNAEHWERWDKPASGKGAANGRGPENFQPSAERIRESNRRLDEFLAGLEKNGGGET